MTYLSLFSGIGGLDLGFTRVGLQCIGQVEINDFCQEILAKHWPNVRRYHDIRKFPPGGNIEPWQADIVAGGFPCKQTSKASAIHGRNLGLDGPDSGLWSEMLRIVRLVRPRIVVIENVPGCLCWADQIESDLERANYCIPFRRYSLSAEDFGAPHQRRRVFWIAYRDCERLEGTWSIESFKIGPCTWGTLD